MSVPALAPIQHCRKFAKAQRDPRSNLVLEHGKATMRFECLCERRWTWSPHSSGGWQSIARVDRGATILARCECGRTHWKPYTRGQGAVMEKRTR